MSVISLKFKDLFEEHYQNLCFFTYTLVNDKILAEDFVQDAFIALYNNQEILDKEAKVLKAYLYTTIKNSVLNWARRTKVERKYHDLTPFVDFVDLDFDNAMIKAETVGEINKIIAKLPDSCQNIFKLYYLEGLSTKEIATQLQLSINTIKTQKQRGLKYIQSKLSPEFFLILYFILK